MILQNETYTALCEVLTQPSLDGFDIVHNTEATDTTDFYMARTFDIQRKDGHSIKIALLDRLCSGGEHYAVPEGNTLTVILFAAIVRIDLDTGAILQREPCENMGGLNEIHEIPDGDIIWGEGNIFRYDRGLNRRWEFTGRDILVSPDNRKHLWIEDNRIHCRDFLGWHYVLDFEGNLICEFYEE